MASADPHASAATSTSAEASSSAGGEEVVALRRTVRDLVALSTLPALWAGQSSAAVLRSLVEALHQLLRGDWVYAERSATGGGEGTVQTAWGNAGPFDAIELGSQLRTLLTSDGLHELVQAADGGQLRVQVASLPLAGATARLACAARRPNFPTGTEQLLINVAVNQGAVALQAAELRATREQVEQAVRISNERLQEESRTVETLRTVGLALAAELELTSLLQHVTDAATELSGAAFGAFFYNVSNEHGESYQLYTLSGVSREAFAGFPMPRNTTVFGPTFRGEGIIRADDITRDPRYGHNPPYYGMPAGHLPVRSYLAVPVVSRSGAVLGGLFFGHSGTGVFGERDERLVSGIAAHAAIALDNARLYEAEHQARAEAEAAVRARDEFLSIAAHELRTPITAIRGSADLALRAHGRGALDAARTERIFSMISTAARHLATLTNDLLDVARLQTGHFELRPERLDLGGLLSRVVERYANLPDTALLFDLQVLDGVIAVQADPVRLEQVLDNVLGNAVKYSPSGGVIEVTLRAASDHALVSVRDTGIGLPSGAEETIFQPFGRARNATDSQLPGLGLGLHICRQIVEQHGGRIWAESPGEGRGTTISIQLPAL